MADLLTLFPPGSARDDDGMLTLGGCRADALAEEFGTPVLVVDEPALRARAREYREALAARWPRSRVVFASKAFPATAVQRVLPGTPSRPIRHNTTNCSSTNVVRGLAPVCNGRPECS